MGSLRALRNDLVRGLESAFVPAALAASAAAVVALAPTVAAAADAPAIERWSVTVSAGKFDRRQAVVTFPLPAGAVPDGEWHLVPAGNGDAPTLQALPPGGRAEGPPDGQSKSPRQGVFVLRDLKAGRSRTFSLVQVKGGEAPPDVVRAVKEGGRIAVTVGANEVLRYQGEKGKLPPEASPPSTSAADTSRPSTHAAGKLVTDDYPPNHKHHHGIWSPWTKTEFEGRHPDFWNMGDKTGTVEFVGLRRRLLRPRRRRLRRKHRFIDLSCQTRAEGRTKRAVGGERLRRRPRRGGGRRSRPAVFPLRLAIDPDVRLGQSADAAPIPLRRPGLPRQPRLGRRRNLTFFTSEGKEGRGANESRARWVYLGGRVDGQPAGVAILCPPENFRFPQPIRIHPTEPFFCYAPEQLGEFKIEPGKRYVAQVPFRRAGR